MPDVATIAAPVSLLRRDEILARSVKILEATTDVVAMTDLDGRLLYLNSTGRSLLGLDEDEPVGQRTLSELQPTWACEIVRHEAFPTALASGSWSGETAVLSGNGTELPVLQLMLAHEDDDGKAEFLSTICRDITDRKQKELERIEWANRYDAAIRASGQVVFDWNTISGGITYGGDTECLLGHSIEAMEGGIERLRQCIHPEDLRKFDAEIEGVMLSRGPFRHELRIIRRDSSEIVMEIRGCFFLDRQGQAGRMVGFLKDVTMERTSERSIQLANERLEQRVVERTAELEQANRELERGVRRQEAVARMGQLALGGLDLHKLMSEAVNTVCETMPVDCTSLFEFDEAKGAFNRLAEAGWPNPDAPVRILGGDASLCAYTLKTGAPVIAEDLDNETRFSVSETVRQAAAKSGLTVNIITGERKFGVLAVFSLSRRDFSQDDVNFVQAIANVLTIAIERHETEEKIQHARSDAEAANQAKTKFLSRMSHELRTPLNSVIGFTQLLEMEEHTERQRESITHISRAGKNLLDLVNEILDIVRLDAGRVQFHMETIDVLELFRGLFVSMTPFAGKRMIELRMAEPGGGEPFVSADRERLREVMLNLISNGVKFNKEGGSVTLAVARVDATKWRISVTDTGIGIPEDKISRLFVPFERLGTREGGTEGGTGLGLALCQRLVKAFNGRIGVASTVGLGSTFWIELPAIEVAPAQAQVSAGDHTCDTPHKPERKEMTVLYIEDDVTNYYLLERILSPKKHIKLLSALQGRFGIEAARKHRPDLILLDLNLPDMRGEEVLRGLRDDPATAGIRVIALTGEVLGEQEKKLKELGFAAVLLKPYKIADITSLVEQSFAMAN